MGKIDKIDGYLEVGAGVARADGARPTHYINLHGPDGPQTVSEFSGTAGLKLNLIQDEFNSGLLVEGGYWTQSGRDGRSSRGLARAGLFLEGESRILSLCGGPLLSERGVVGFGSQLLVGRKLSEHLLVFAGFSYSSTTLHFTVEPYEVSPDAAPDVRKDAAETEVEMEWSSTGVLLGLSLLL